VLFAGGCRHSKIVGCVGGVETNCVETGATRSEIVNVDLRVSFSREIHVQAVYSHVSVRHQYYIVFVFKRTCQIMCHSSQVHCSINVSFFVTVLFFSTYSGSSHKWYFGQSFHICRPT